MSVSVPLISALLAALVALVVARQQGISARDSWVLDKRYVLCEGVLDMRLALVRGDDPLGAQIPEELRAGQHLSLRSTCWPPRTYGSGLTNWPI